MHESQIKNCHQTAFVLPKIAGNFPHWTVPIAIQVLHRSEWAMSNFFQGKGGQKHVNQALSDHLTVPVRHVVGSSTFLFVTWGLVKSVLDRRGLVGIFSPSPFFQKWV